MKVVAADLRRGMQRWCIKMSASAAELNALDAKLGDGDLGVTLERCADLLRAALPATPDNISELFKSASKVCLEASGSSFGTLLAVGLLSAAKETKGCEELERSDVSALLKSSADAISQRGEPSRAIKLFWIRCSLREMHSISLQQKTLVRQPLTPLHPQSANFARSRIRLAEPACSEINLSE